MKINVNTIIEWISQDNQQNQVERILQISSDQQLVVTIDIFSKKGLPRMRSYDEILIAYNSADLRFLEYDPFSNPESDDEEIPKKYLLIRDSSWMIVEKVISSAGGNLFLAKKFVVAVSKEFGKPPKTVYGYMRRYFQSGCIKNSLLPNFKKCGGRGKKKLANNPHKIKLGRPSRLSVAEGVNRGVFITPVIEKLFKKGIKEFYLTADKNSFRAAYEKTIAKYFNIGYEYDNDVRIPILPSADKLPTERQFRYWYEVNLKNPKDEKRCRLGETKFNLLFRDLTGDSTSLSFGPGSIYMIDATIADVYLVSSFDRNRIIGRPVIYLIIDVFSRLVVGFSVSLEGPSWLGAMLALDNMVADKIYFCNEYGVSIQPWQWDCHHLPEAIFADRGEFEGYSADVLVNVLGITIHNTPPYRADLKGIVERHFGLVKEKFVKFIPGAVIKGRQRGEKDHRLDGLLTLNDFRALMITHILDYNHNHKLSWYRPDEFQVADHVPLKPISLWNWGIKNRSGMLRSIPRDNVRLNLLPRKKATVTRYGIHFEKDIYYSIPSSIKKRGKLNKTIIAYDPRNIDYIYLPSDNENNEIISCPLTPASKLYLGRDLQETHDLFALQSQGDEIDQSRQLQSKALFLASAENIIKKAECKKKYNLPSDEQSNSEKLKNIKKNRFDERNYEREKNAWTLGDINNSKYLPAITQKNDDYIPAPNYFDEIDAVLNEVKGE